MRLRSGDMDMAEILNLGSCSEEAENNVRSGRRRRLLFNIRKTVPRVSLRLKTSGFAANAGGEIKKSKQKSVNWKPKNRLCDKYELAFLP